MQRLWRYCRPYGVRWVWGTCLLLATNGATLAIPELFRFAIDGIHHRHEAFYLQQVAICLITIALAGACFRTLSRVNIFLRCA